MVIPDKRRSEVTVTTSSPFILSILPFLEKSYAISVKLPPGPFGPGRSFTSTSSNSY